MDCNDVDELLRRYRKKPLFDTSALRTVAFDRDGVQRVVPHRDPYLLVDAISGLDISQQRLAGERLIPADEPLFRGHFPNFPVYPGTKLVEMIGQLSLCLHYFVSNNTSMISPEAQPIQVRATRILGAYFLRPVLPGERVLLLAQGLSEDGFHARAVGQAVVNGEIACVSAGEVVFLD